MNNLLYFQKMRQFFVRKGKKNVLENVFKNYLINCATVKPTNLTNLLGNAYANSVSYIKLKTRRRGKRIKYKVGFLEKKDGMRKALLAFSKTMNVNKGNNFANVFEKELENLSSGKSTVMAQRNAMHEIALKNVPYR
jgi:ribosomal protein S7